MSDYKGAALMLPALPKARALLADKGYDADWFRAALAKKRTASPASCRNPIDRKVRPSPMTPSRQQRTKSKYMFGQRLRRFGGVIPHRWLYDRVAPTPTACATCIAAAVAFWL